MVRKFLDLIAFFFLALVAWVVDMNYHYADSNKVIYSFIAISISYFIFKIVFEGVISKRIHELRIRYTFKKTTSILFIVLSIAILAHIWIIDTSALLVTFGVLTAGIAFALQDVVKNFAGSLAIFISGIYYVDNRIEVNNVCGDVIDVGLFYTSLLEIGKWVGGDQATGRIITIPNGYVLSYPVYNYSKDHGFIWDEISIPLTHESNWEKAVKSIQNAVDKETMEIQRVAEREILNLQEKYFISKRNTQTMVFVAPTDKYIMLHVRYITEVRERRTISDRLTKLILNIITDSEDMQISAV